MVKKRSVLTPWFILTIPIGWRPLKLEVVSPSGKRRVLWCQELNDKDRR